MPPKAFSLPEGPLAQSYQGWFLEYASYVILDRAVPHIDDGLKPVQRRILHTLWEMDDGRYHKVANVVGAHQIPFLAVRVISDDYHQVLPAGALAAGFDPALGQATPLRLLAYLSTHPREIGPFKKFVTGLSGARRNLTKFLEQLNQELPASW